MRSRPLGEGIPNSFAVEDTGAVYIVTDTAMYRLEAGATGLPEVVWREAYENSGVQKPGQSSAGSGTTLTLMGSDLVAITDNADPMNVVVYRGGRSVAGPRVICRQPVFEKGASVSTSTRAAAAIRSGARLSTRRPWCRSSRPRTGSSTPCGGGEFGCALGSCCWTGGGW